MPVEVITRRSLPHWYVPGAVHFVTYRLADTIPQDVLDRWHDDFHGYCQRAAAQGVPDYRHRAHKRYYGYFDDYLDANRERNWLSNPQVAAVIRGNLYHHNTSLYHLIAYCVMPNHVHVLLQPTDPQSPAKADAEEVIGERSDAKSPLSRIMHSLKSYTASQANKILGRSGRFWQPESYDHWVRDDEELERIIAYIAANPVKAKLTSRPIDWHFSSAQDRYLTDGCEDGWLRAPLPAELVICPQATP